MLYVLLFPPVNNFRRFLIHQTCENFRQQYDLFTFSVGQGPFRRTVVCFKNQLLDPAKFADTAAAANFETRNKQSPVKSWRSERRTDNNALLPTSSQAAGTKRQALYNASKMGVEKNLSETRLCKSHSVDIYRPPALRNISSSSVDLPQVDASKRTGASTTATSTVADTGCRASSSTTNTATNTSISCTSSLFFTNDGDECSSDNLATTLRNASELLPTLQLGPSASAVSAHTQRAQATTRRERRPDRAVYIPRARRSQTTPPTTATTIVTTATTMTTEAATATSTGTTTTNPTAIKIAACSNSIQQLPTASVGSAPSPKMDEVNRSASAKKSKSTNSNNVNNKERKERPAHKKTSAVNKNSKSLDALSATTAGTADIPITHHVLSLSNAPVRTATNTEQLSSCNDMHPAVVMGETATELHNGIDMLSGANVLSHLRIEDALHALPSGKTRSDAAKCDIDEQELQRASKEINRSNRRIMKQTFVSDILEIPEKIELEKPNKQNDKIKKVNTPAPVSNRSPTDSATEEEYEEDDWETMYDESGECLDPKIMQELAASVGKVKIELPKMDYSAYLTKQAILNEEEFPHVLEVSNFPVEFKNQDLFMVFSQYKESGFEIKWVDDTHALAVFSSSRIAAEVLTMGHPFVVLKPLAEATLESRLKAKKCAASLQPYRPRPETCAALARRLVTGALGVRLETAAAERENEKRVLREAKERKLLAAKQRDEVWES